MPSKFGANLGPNSGAAVSDGSAKTFDTFDASNSPANVPQPTSAANSPDLVEQTNSANAGPAPVSTPQNPFSRDQVISSSPDDHPVYTKASGSGDIVLNSSHNNVSKKPLIILGIVALIAGLIIAIVALLLSNFGKNSSNVAGAESKFNQYANYVLYGTTDGTVLEGEYDNKTDYKIIEEFYSEDYNEEFWQTAESMLGASVEKYSGVDDEHKKTELEQYLKDYQTAFQFVKKQKTTTESTEMQVLEKFLTEGTDVVNRFLDESYGLEGNFSADIYSKESAEDDGPNNIEELYYKAKWTMLKAQVETYDLYNRFGCIYDGQLDSACSNMDTDSSARILSLQDIVSEAKTIANQTLEDSVDSLAQDCWVVSEWYQASENLEIYEESAE